LKRLAEGLQLLLLGLWVGGMVGFGAFMAPVLFGTVPSRQLAGNVAGQVIQSLSSFGVTMPILVILLHVLARRRWDWRLSALTAVLILNALNATYVRGGIDRAQAAMPRPIEEYAVTDPLRVEYNRWHRLSNNIGMGAVVLGLAVLGGWRFARD
jgi:hypothetical protein